MKFAILFMVLGMVGCAQREDVSPAIHELQDKVAHQQQEIDSLKREIEQQSNSTGSATATGDCAVAETGSGNTVTFNGEDGCPPKTKKHKEQP